MSPIPRRFPLRAFLAALPPALLLAAAAGTAAPARKKAPAPRPVATAPAKPDTAPAPPLATVTDTLARAWVMQAVLAHGGRAAWEGLRDLRWTESVVQHGREGAIRSGIAEESLRRGTRGWSFRLETRSGPAPGMVFVTTPDTTWSRNDSEAVGNRRALTFAPSQLALERTLLSFPWRLAPEGGAILTSVPDSADAQARVVDAILPDASGVWRLRFDPTTSRIASLSWWHHDFVGAPEYHVELGEYVQAGELRVASKRVVFVGADTQPSVEYELSAIEANTGLPDSLFRRR